MREEAKRSNFTNEAADWFPLTRIRPYAGSDADLAVEMNNPLLKQRLGMSRQALLELIAAPLRGPSSSSEAVAGYLRELGFLGGDRRLDESTRAGIAHWVSRNWLPSLDLYLWSRRWEFDDNGATFEEARDQALKRFLEEDGEPPISPVASGQCLTPPAKLPQTPMGQVLWERSSSYRAAPTQLPQEVLSAILHHGWTPFRVDHIERVVGDTPDYGYLVGLDRVYDLYFAAFDVSGLAPGIYRYDVRTEQIELVRAGEFRHDVQECLIGQRAPLTASTVLFLTTDFLRIQWVYRHDRVIRNTYINAGKIMQSLLLVATAEKLMTSITPAVSDRKALGLLGLDPHESQVLYTLALS